MMETVKFGMQTGNASSIKHQFLLMIEKERMAANERGNPI